MRSTSASACALLRPEAWPFLGLYGLWLWFAEPRLRLRMVGCAALIPALWFLPEWWGSGDPFRAGARANAPNPGSVAFAERPPSSCSRSSRRSTISPVELGVVIATAYAVVAWVRRRAEGQTLALAALGFGWFALVAVMTEAGFAGNQRYLIVTTAAVCVLGGIGMARVIQGVGWLGERVVGNQRAGTIAAAAFLALGLLIATPIIRAKANNISRVRAASSTRRSLARPQGGDRPGRRQGAAAGLRRGLQRSVPDPDGRLRARHPRHPGRLEGDPAAGVAFRTRTVPDGPLVTKPTDDRFRLVGVNGKGRVLTVPPTGGDGRCPRCRSRRSHGPARGNRPTRWSTRIRAWQASPPAPHPAPGSAGFPLSFVLPALVLVGLLIVSVYLRTKSLGASLWMDEGLSIGIASQPLLDIPHVLRMDGSPPLYYMLLSVWMDVFGDGPRGDAGALDGRSRCSPCPAGCGPAGASSAAVPG